MINGSNFNGQIKCNVLMLSYFMLFFRLMIPAAPCCMSDRRLEVTEIQYGALDKPGRESTIIIISTLEII